MNSIFGKITLGADPEVFIVRDDTPWGAACTKVTGTKEDPQERPYGAIQVDGLALEYNIHPVTDLSEWVRLHNEALEDVGIWADDIYCVVDNNSLLDFSEYIDDTKPSEDSDELLFGCDPDFNADTMKENTMPDNDGSIKFRTTGGHVHVGMENWGELCPDEETAHMVASKIVMCLDAILGVPSVLRDDGAERKKLYGKAGAYRVKPYGVEYRTLSNYWVFDNDDLEAIFTTTMGLFDDAYFVKVSEWAEENRADVVACINNNDRDLAMDLADRMANEIV